MSTMHSRFRMLVLFIPVVFNPTKFSINRTKFSSYLYWYMVYAKYCGIIVRGN
eukprot:SAG11_NODE_31356_length_292_cov_1.077720_1_plen_52_part_01